VLPSFGVARRVVDEGRFAKLKQRVAFLVVAALAAFAGWSVGDAPAPSADTGPSRPAISTHEQRLDKLAEKLCHEVGRLAGKDARAKALRFVSTKDLEMEDGVEVVNRAYLSCVPSMAVQGAVDTRNSVVATLRAPKRHCPSTVERRCTRQGSVPKSRSPKSPNPGMM
jgi:hypothetical protein